MNEPWAAWHNLPKEQLEIALKLDKRGSAEFQAAVFWSGTNRTSIGICPNCGNEVTVYAANRPGGSRYFAVCPPCLEGSSGLRGYYSSESYNFLSPHR